MNLQNLLFLFLVFFHMCSLHIYLHSNSYFPISAFLHTSLGPASAVAEQSFVLGTGLESAVQLLSN
jgi:hypothetical protein